MARSPVSWGMRLEPGVGNKGAPCEGCPNYTEDCLLMGVYFPNARITLIVESPGPSAIANQHPIHASDQNYTILHSLTDYMKEFMTGGIKYNVVYLVGARSSGAPRKEVVRACHGYVRKKLYDYRQQYALTNKTEGVHVLIPMGATASRALVPGNLSMKEMRGRRYNLALDGYDYAVMPTLGVSNISVKPGVARIVRDDMIRAWDMSRRANIPEETSIEEISKNYIVPKTLEEVEEVCNLIIQYSGKEGVTPEAWPISVDTETNTLHPYAPYAKVIMVSFAWDDGKATAITLDHPDAPYNADGAWPHVKRVLACAKPKIFHNAKYDWQMLELCADAPINNIWWDTMLAEHFLDEDKKGFYGLKIVTGLYAPQYQGYEERLNLALRDDASVRETFNVPLDQKAPDASLSWALRGFFPDIDYAPVAESDEADTLEFEDRSELFGFEHKYLRAHRDGDTKTKSSFRAKIRHRCTKHDLPMPDFAKSFDFSAQKGQGFENIPLPILQKYAGADADVTRIICREQRQFAFRRTPGDPRAMLTDCENIMSQIHVRATTVLGRMQYLGTRMNLTEIARYESEIAVYEEEYLQKLRDIVCDANFNPNSAKDLTKILGGAIPVDEEDLVYTDNGALSVRKEWAASMAQDPKYLGTETDGPSVTGSFFEALLIYRAAQKARTTFLKNLRELSGIDGRIHTSFHLNGTSTGRLSSSNMNLQNIPLWLGRYSRGDKVIVPGWNIKKLFIPSDDDHVFFQLDIAAAEIRVLCAYAQDEKLLQALDEGLDIHSFIASHIFEPSYAEFMAGKDSDPHIKHLRTAAKRVVFGTLYGAGSYKIAQQIFGTLSTHEEERERQIKFAQDTIDMFFARFPTVNTYVTSTQKEVKTGGRVRTFFGRYRRFSFAAGGRNSWKLRMAAEREAVNFKIQSTSSDLVLSQLIEVDKHFHEIGGKVLLTVHDSIAGEIRREHVPEMKAFFDHWIVERIQEQFDWMPVPFKYDLEIGPNYGELAPFEVLELMRRPPLSLSEKQHKLLNKSQPILEAAKLWEPYQLEVANAG